MSGFVDPAKTVAQPDLATLQEGLQILRDTIERQRLALTQLDPSRVGALHGQLHQTLTEMNAVLPRCRTNSGSGARWRPCCT
jgi:hypothetical protein